jgi:hypothetical protein
VVLKRCVQSPVLNSRPTHVLRVLRGRAAMVVAAVLSIAACVSDETQPIQSLSLQQQIDFAISDLAQSRGVERDAVSTSSAQEVSWRSGAIGCPAPGMNYTQALVPGSRIILKLGKEKFEYHAASGGPPFFCPADRVESPAETSAAG